MTDSTTLFSPLHTWARKAGDEYVIGISYFAQNALGDLVYIELPELGKQLVAGDIAGVAESVKTASDILAPINGTVTAVNAALEDEPELINDDPLGKGWIFKIKASQPEQFEQLLSEADYLAQVKN